MKIGCVVMAAGNSQRFGANKLLAELDGKPLIRRALEAVPREKFSQVAVVTQYPQVQALAEEYGFGCICNDRPELGASLSVRLGVQVMAECDAIVFMVADQPRLRRETVAALVDFFAREAEKIAALSHGGSRGNPCVFPAAFFAELLALEGDRGGSAVIRRHGDALRLLECAAEELQDVDELGDLAALGG